MVNRREFLRTVSLGALAVGSAPALVDVARGLALAEGQRGVRFLAVSAAGTAPFSLPQAPVSARGLGHLEKPPARGLPGARHLRGPCGGDRRVRGRSLPRKAVGGTPGPFRQIPPAGTGLTVFLLPEVLG